MEAPDWLKARDGSLKPGVNGHVVLVMVGGQPQYRLEARPAAGKSTCVVSQTVNGRRLDDGTTYPTAGAGRQLAACSRASRSMLA